MDGFYKYTGNVGKHIFFSKRKMNLFVKPPEMRYSPLYRKILQMESTLCGIFCTCVEWYLLPYDKLRAMDNQLLKTINSIMLTFF